MPSNTTCEYPFLYLYSDYIMAIKMFLMLGLVLLAQAYTEENHVLVLTDEDLPGVISEFPYILIEFYAPWYSSSQAGADTAKN